MTLTVTGANAEARKKRVSTVEQFMKKQLPGTNLMFCLEGECLFQLPRDATNAQMVAMFKALEANAYTIFSCRMTGRAECRRSR